MFICLHKFARNFPFSLKVMKSCNVMIDKNVLQYRVKTGYELLYPGLYKVSSALILKTGATQ